MHLLEGFSFALMDEVGCSFCFAHALWMLEWLEELMLKSTPILALVGEW